MAASKTPAATSQAPDRVTGEDADGATAARPTGGGRVAVAGVRVARAGSVGGGPVRRTFGRLGGLVAGIPRSVRKATHSKGAGESGLAKLIELHGINNAGDALITLALATTVFFSVPTGQARDRVALYLLITMVPFTLMAPVIGPLLDRLRRGRRVAMAITMLTRATLAWFMAHAVKNGSLELYPEAFGVLIASKAYGVTRSAVVPRLQPRSVSLVKVNSRITMFGLIGTMVAAPVAGLCKVTVGVPWILYTAIVVFTFGAGLSLALPSKVDSAKGEERASFTSDTPGTEHEPRRRWFRRKHDAAPDEPKEAKEAKQAKDPQAEAVARATRASRRLRSVGPSVVQALWANAAMRAFSGFLIFFLAFLLREQPLGSLKSKTALAAVAGAAAIGNALGTALGSWLKARGPEVIVFGTLVVAFASAAAATLHYGTATVMGVAGVAGLAQALGKLSLDAMIQRDIPEEVRTSAFARTETALQLAWVVGGGVGIALPLNGTLGMSVAAGALLLALLLPGRRLATRRARRKRSPGARLRGAR